MIPVKLSQPLSRGLQRIGVNDQQLGYTAAMQILVGHRSYPLRRREGRAVKGDKLPQTVCSNPKDSIGSIQRERYFPDLMDVGHLPHFGTRWAIRQIEIRDLTCPDRSQIAKCHLLESSHIELPSGLQPHIIHPGHACRVDRIVVGRRQGNGRGRRQKRGRCLSRIDKICSLPIGYRIERETQSLLSALSQFHPRS